MQWLVLYYMYIIHFCIIISKCEKINGELTVNKMVHTNGEVALIGHFFHLSVEQVKYQFSRCSNFHYNELIKKI